MVVDRCPTTQAWRVSMVIAGFRESRRYMGYTRDESIAAFELEFNL
jgi:hypothetical protein